MSRPSFLDIVGNRQVRERLQHQVEAGETFPSLLFQGPQGVGKRLSALWYAALVNCLSEDRPCGTCIACRKVASGNHPDVLLQERPAGKTVIGVGEVREGIHQASYMPYEGRFRVWILAEGERLTEEAQNSLLKTLEEPPDRVLIVLVCAAAGMLLPTVRSRCRALTFRPIESRSIAEFLQGQGCPPDRSQVLAQLADGRIGEALRLYSDPRTWERRESVLDLLLELPGKDLWGAVERSQQLDALKLPNGDARQELEETLEVGRSLYRDYMMQLSAGPEVVLHGHRQGQIEAVSKRLGLSRVQKGLERLAEAGQHLRHNVQTKLLLQRLCLRLAKGD